ncbi:Retrovirus-related Pol polyprotein from transposon RE2-like protein [Drosera capensis]
MSSLVSVQVSVSLPPWKQVVGCHWVFVVKCLPYGLVERRKTSLVAIGYIETYGIDYDETFSTMAKTPFICIVLSLAAQFCWPLYQFDVKNVFFLGELWEKMYMEHPSGFVA